MVIVGKKQLLDAKIGQETRLRARDSKRVLHAPLHPAPRFFALPLEMQAWVGT
jgi:hypothetical protein